MPYLPFGLARFGGPECRAVSRQDRETGGGVAPELRRGRERVELGEGGHLTLERGQ
jgi:hypothetical protein